MIHPKSKYQEYFDMENFQKRGNGRLEIIKLYYSILIKNIFKTEGLGGYASNV